MKWGMTTWHTSSLKGWFKTLQKQLVFLTYLLCYLLILCRWFNVPLLKYQPVRFLPLPKHQQILGNQDTLKVHETGPLRMRHVQLSKTITRLCLHVSFLIIYTYTNTSLWQYRKFSINTLVHVICMKNGGPGGLHVNFLKTCKMQTIRMSPERRGSCNRCTPNNVSVIDEYGLSLTLHIVCCSVHLWNIPNF